MQLIIISTKMGKSTDTSKAAKVCSEHPRQLYKFYCHTCKSKICIVCVEAHKSHEFKLLQQLIQELTQPW